MSLNATLEIFACSGIVVLILDVVLDFYTHVCICVSVCPCVCAFMLRGCVCLCI